MLEFCRQKYLKVQQHLAANYVKANEQLLKSLTLRNQLIDVKSEVKSEADVPIKAEDYLAKFETDAAGFVVDELPQEYVHKFLSYLQKCNKTSENMLDPFKVPKQKVDPNDPHLHVEEQKVGLGPVDKKRPMEAAKPSQAQGNKKKPTLVSGQSVLQFKKSN